MSSSHLFGSVYTLNGEIYLMATSYYLIFFKCCHLLGMDFRYICVISHISTFYKSCVFISTNRAVNNFKYSDVLPPSDF